MLDSPCSISAKVFLPAAEQAADKTVTIARYTPDVLLESGNDTATPAATYKVPRLSSVLEIRQAFLRRLAKLHTLWVLDDHLLKQNSLGNLQVDH